MILQFRETLGASLLFHFHLDFWTSTEHLAFLLCYEKINNNDKRIWFVDLKPIIFEKKATNLNDENKDHSVLCQKRNSTTNTTMKHTSNEMLKVIQRHSTN
uniref:Uncharacterized protein n=1 Tax=Cacopsylla melanoneura TaxID=428564 RepID=A0A8D8Z462_9HEMI